jgi:rSAM/selenodomain-associated transferase 1
MPSTPCAIAVMAKGPQPGRTKTRLIPPLSAGQAASLAAAFLRDITDNIALAARQAAIRGFIAYAPAGTEGLFDGHLAPGTGLLLADGSFAPPSRAEALGRSLLHAADALHRAGFGAICLLNADSPTLPTEFLCRAARALAAPGERIVLGPAEDGGYYLIGMTAPHAHLFEDIAWSTDRVAAQTRARAATLGLEVVELPAWYDVDDRAALARLLEEIGGARPSAAGAPYPAPATAAWSARVGARALLRAAP